MYPILFDANETTYTNNGLGRLSDCISCLVTEERNGIYELELQYPITGIHYEDIQIGDLIVTSHDEQKDLQPFVIYQIAKPMDGVVTVNAHHVSYALSSVILQPFTATSTTDALEKIPRMSITENPFTYWTDKTGGGSFKLEIPKSCKSVLGGESGSLLDSFGGGEYEFDKWNVKLYQNRGSNNGVTIRYGKNLADILHTTNILDLYNAVVPYWTDSESTVVYGGVVLGSGGIHKTAYWTDEDNTRMTDENGVEFEFTYTSQSVVALDLSSYFENKPTVEQLETQALSYLNSNTPWIPKVNINVDFVALWQTEEYKDIAPLERVQLCDTVGVYYPELGVNATAKVIKVVWDALLERYESVELGDAKTSFADSVISQTQAQIYANVPTNSIMADAIQHASELITGGLGGNITFLYDADGRPTDMLVMDTDNVESAINVLRINVNGIGFSHNGVSGPFLSAWTLDGAFVADWITAGTMSCDRLQGGVLTLGGFNNEDGKLYTYDSRNVINSVINADGMITVLEREVYDRNDELFQFIGISQYAARLNFGIYKDEDAVKANNMKACGYITTHAEETEDKEYAIGLYIGAGNSGVIAANGEVRIRIKSSARAESDGTTQLVFYGTERHYGVTRFESDVYHYDDIFIRSDNITASQTVSSSINGKAISYSDSENTNIGNIIATQNSDGAGLQLNAHNIVNGSDVFNSLSLKVNPSGTPYVYVSYPAKWRSALGIPGSLSITSVSFSFSVNAGSASASQTIATGINTSSYKIIGIVGFVFTGTSRVYFTPLEMRMDGADVLFGVYNRSTSAQTAEGNVKVLKMAL